eukprot:12982950-Alexandrium_andersonii.AAC.1
MGLARRAEDLRIEHGFEQWELPDYMTKNSVPHAQTSSICLALQPDLQLEERLYDRVLNDPDTTPFARFNGHRLLGSAGEEFDDAEH